MERSQSALLRKHIKLLPARVRCARSSDALRHRYARLSSLSTIEYEYCAVLVRRAPSPALFDFLPSVVPGRNHLLQAEPAARQRDR